MADGTHHHGPLAGISAGAAAVLTGGGLILVAARRQIGEVATVVAWALMAAVAGAVAAAAVYVFLWLRHRVRYPETLASRHAVRAEVVDAEIPQANGRWEHHGPDQHSPIEHAYRIDSAAQPAAIEPPRVYLNVTDDQLEAIMRRHPEEG